MKKEMLINCLQTEEIRIAIIENGVLDELYVERASAESYVGNIYKGRVVNIEPSIQAAFVDFGVGRNGFLHVSDVEPAYYREIEERQHGRGGDRGGRGGDRGGDRGGRGRPQRNYDDYDRPPQRDYRQPPHEEPMAGSPHDAPMPPPNDAIFSESHTDAPVHDEHAPDIIIEEIYEEDDYVAEPPAAEPMPEPVSSPQEDWPTPTESRSEVFEDVPLPPLDDEPVVEALETPADEPTTEDPVKDDDESKTKRKAPARGKARAPRGRKPRKTAEKAPEETLPTEDLKPRPMDSNECRTGPDDPSFGPIEPRPASKDDLTDDDLTFSSAPPPVRSYAPPPKPVEVEEEIIVQEEEFEEPETAHTRHEEMEPGPMEPAIAKNDPVESLEDLVEEEKLFEDEDEAVVNEIHADEVPPPDPDDEFSRVEEYVPRDRGRSGDRRGGGRDGGRGGRDGGRGGRDGGRGGRPGGRDQGRGGRDQGRRMGGGGRPAMLRPKPNIEEIFKRGQEVLVQVIKEGIGTKGPTLSTYISIAGRYLVLMPGLNRIGVSRKIEDDTIRRRLREIMNELKPPHGIGFIIRTAGQDRNKNELQSDLAYLSRLWQVVAGRIKRQKSPCEIYRESDMVTRTIRDIFTEDIQTIWVDERGAYEAAKEFMEAVMPRYADRIKFYDGTVPMFHKHGIETEIARIQERKISLPHGGSIVIDQTEALVAIDVNSGNFRADNNNAEETAYQMNLHAAKEIARQLRLRDLGGVIVNDFIDMREDRHRRGVEKALRDAVQRDRARTKILRISQFGLIEMTRQRIRPSLKRSAFQDCTHCKGTGHVKTVESVSIEVMRMLQLAVNREHIQRIDIRVHDEVAQYLLNRKRKEIVALEDTGKKLVSITSAGAGVSPEFLEFQCLDNNGNEVKFAIVEEAPPRPPQRRRR